MCGSVVFTPQLLNLFKLYYSQSPLGQLIDSIIAIVCSLSLSFHLHRRQVHFANNLSLTDGNMLGGGGGSGDNSLSNGNFGGNDKTEGQYFAVGFGI